MPTISENQRSHPLRQIVPGHCRASNPRGDAAKFGVQWWRIHPITNGKIHGKIRLSSFIDWVIYMDFPPITWFSPITNGNNSLIGGFTWIFYQKVSPNLWKTLGFCCASVPVDHLCTSQTQEPSQHLVQHLGSGKSQNPWITTHLWTIHGKWLITWVKDMTH